MVDSPSRHGENRFPMRRREKCLHCITKCLHLSMDVPAFQVEMPAFLSLPYAGVFHSLTGFNPRPIGHSHTPHAETIPFQARNRPFFGKVYSNGYRPVAVLIPSTYDFDTQIISAQCQKSHRQTRHPSPLKNSYHAKSSIRLDVLVHRWLVCQGLPDYAST